MLARLFQPHLTAFARAAATATLAFLLVVAGWSPARALQALPAAGSAQAVAGAGDAAEAKPGLRAAEDATADQRFDAAVPGRLSRLPIHAFAARAGHRPTRAAAPVARRVRPRAPPIVA